ncbi:MAG: thermonuclease family protein [Bosea sp. (in: a-proteobacteria)]
MTSQSYRFLCTVFATGLVAGTLLATALPGAVREAAARNDATIRKTDTSPAVNTRTPLAGAYQAQVLNVVDGDTVEARVHVWMGQEVVTRIRLKDIDAPEVTGACGPERERAIAARDRLAELVHGAGIVLADVRPDKYFGRVVARVVMSDGQDAGAILLSEGLARPYRGGRRQSWCVLQP